MKPNWEQMCAVAEGEVARIVADLPSPLQERAEAVPVVLERWPSMAMQADGIEEDTLGLFVGPEWAEAGEVPAPTQIILYLENIWEAAETEGQRFGDEIATTFLHELGHFLGLGEDDLRERGLE